MATEHPALVADASVIAKWFLVVSNREAALRLREDFVSGTVSLASPALMPFEVMNAVRFSRKSVSVSTLKSVAKSLLLYGVELYPLNEYYVDLTMETSVRNGLTIYDGSYLALARHLGSVLYTANRELLDDLRKADKRYAKHIDDYPPRTREPGAGD